MPFKNTKGIPRPYSKRTSTTQSEESTGLYESGVEAALQAPRANNIESHRAERVKTSGRNVRTEECIPEGWRTLWCCARTGECAEQSKMVRDGTRIENSFAIWEANAAFPRAQRKPQHKRHEWAAAQVTELVCRPTRRTSMHRDEWRREKNRRANMLIWNRRHT